MKTRFLLRKKITFTFIGVLSTLILSAQVTVNATGGVATATYASLRLAFNAVNAGTHTGNIAIAITASTTETAPCVLNSSGAGAASYANIAIAPSVDAVIISGATSAGRGIIELNGADNVIIDGDNPNTGGTNRNLTIRNTAAVNISYTSCVRLATSTLVTNCNNDVIRNLNLTGSGVGRNTAAYTTEVVTWGVIASGNASSTASTTAPSPLSSATILVPAGQTLTSLTISNNNIQSVSRGISVNGSATSVAASLMISNNTIGNPVIGAADQVTGVGITAQGTSNGTIIGNTVCIESFIATSGINRAINVGLVSTAGVSGMIVEKNNVLKCYNNNVKTRSAIGIDISGGTNHIIKNNFIGQCLNSQAAGTSSFSTSTGVCGIRILGGTGHQIYHNTVHLTGAIPGVSGRNIVAALLVNTLTATGLDIRNNIFSNQVTGGNPTLYNTVVVSVFLPSAGTSAFNLTLNNNTYYQGTLGQNGIAQVGTTASAANLYKSVNFNAAATSPANNFRSYTSTLSPAGTNDNASYASSNAAPVVAPTDLHISFASAELTNVDQKGDPTVSVLNDIDGDVRPSASTTNPDIGADEFIVPTCLAASGGTITPSSYSACVGQTLLLTSVGATNALGVTYQWKSSNTAGGPYTNVSGGSGANTVSYTTPTLTAGTKYYILQTTCSFGPLTGLSNEVTVVTNTLPTVTLSGGSSFCAGGSVTLTGTSGGTSQWYINDSLIVGATSNTYAATSAGTYNMIKTNISGCSDSAATGITVTVNSLPTVTSSATATSVCLGNNTTLSGGGATSYAWTGGITNGVSFSPSASATYTVTGTDVNGCTNTATQSITVNTPPTVTASTTAATVCLGNNTTLSGGGATSYAWTGGITNGVSFAPSASATYTVTGTDINGCTNTATESITVNTLPTISAMATPATICAGETTTLMGMGASSYTWTGGVTDNVGFIPSATATYTVTGTDVNGCTNTSTQSVTVNTLPTITTMATPSTVCSGNSTTLMGMGASSYTWTGGVTDGVSFVPASTATYTVTGTDINGCSNTSIQSVTVNTLPSVSASASATTICAGNATTLTGAGATSYSWSGGITDNVSFVPASTATYTVTGTDVNGCTNTATQSITVNALPSIAATASPATVCSGNATTLTATGGTSYSWSGGITDNVSFVPVASATYTVTGTDVNGCTNTTTQSVTVNALPSVSFAPFSTPYCNNASAFTLTGGSPAGGTYSGTAVSGGMFDPTAAGAGTYLITYSYSDSNSCTNTDTASVTVDICSGIAYNNADAAVTIYPNPSNGMFTIAIHKAIASEMNISIVDVQGKVIYNHTESTIANGFTKEIDLNSISKGIYSVKLTSNNNVNVYKLVIQ